MAIRRFLWLLVLPLGAQEPVRFSRDVLPLLSDKCLSCHGGDPTSRMAGLRLDTREGATAKVIVPGKPDESLLLKRITESNPIRLMPPARSHKARLTEQEVGTLRTWIEQGAAWGKHWSFEPPVRSAGGSIDSFIDARLQTKNGEASRHTLLRRLSFDLIGLPPSAELLAEPIYDRAIDKLLASSHFGERMAMWWLDGARYSDTDGFQADASRTNWPWRDWVVAAFNRNLSFRDFTIEQFAGDLLPNPTPDQRIATAFHRNHMTNGEGGRDPEESRVDYVLDRANTTGTVWLGLTLGCTQCHSHKFDPITHHDYYSFTAFFNSIDEDGQAGKKAKPYFSYASPYAVRAVAEAEKLVEQRRPAELVERQRAEKPFAEWLKQQTGSVRGGFQAWRTLRMADMQSAEGTKLVQDSEGIVRAGGPNPKQDDYRLAMKVGLRRITGLRLEVLPPLTRGASGEFLLTDIKVQVRQAGSSQIRDINVRSAVADYQTDKKSNNNYGEIKDTLDDDPRNGWTTKGGDRNVQHTAVFELEEPLVLAADEELLFEMRHRSTAGDANIANFRLSATDQRGPAVRSLEVAPLEALSRGPLTPALRERLFEQFLADHAPYLGAREALDRALRQYEEVKSAGTVDVMVLADRATPRDTHILLRGVWDKKGDVVPAAVLPAIAPMPPGEPANRLGLARWLVSGQNPLTARVIVNQLWQMLFGYGLVRTTEDFGLQGEQPTHPELLDWLAVEFVESGWDVKHILRVMVKSAAYKRDSRATPAMIASDPENRTMARGPRFRLPSWMLRDAALQYAGLLNPAIGGPPVRPYQPDGVWEELFMGRFKYEPSEGAAQYRRTLYAFWRRTIAPTFLFDSAQRRSCEVRTARTNTPLQALTLLNDQTYLEASRVLAASSVQDIFSRVLSRRPEPSEMAVLDREYARSLAHYRAHPADSAKLIGGAANPELAARMIVASMILNLDEAITHE
ncbi:MAG TPA: PSD1 and planctomycete cytochrome C domain-containing protein [Bryobacteraceae bacterium]|nr:PSD1 and planctomycete cytochrome C domain-containing protein [Bryobacteraceae bacterium]